jgi:uncharacterized protein (TIGR02246 family)
MTRKLVIGGILCGLTAALWVCLPGLHVNAQEADEQAIAARDEIAAVLEAYVTAFEAKDIEGVMKLFAEGETTVMMGTGEDEVWIGKETIRAAHNAFFESIEKETSERKLLASQVFENVAWLNGYTISTQQTDDGEEKFQLNVSIVLEKQGADWRVVSLHFSRNVFLEQS